MSDIVNKLWGMCHTLRHDGIDYGDYIEQLTYLLFLKMADEKDVKLPIGAAVLNAKDDMLVEMAELCHGEVIFFSSEANLPVITQHRANGTGPTQGKRAVIIRNDKIVLASGTNELLLLNLREISAESGMKSTQAIENILATVAAAWALGIEPEVIRVGIETFGFSQDKYKPENQNLSTGLQTQGIKL